MIRSPRLNNPNFIFDIQSKPEKSQISEEIINNAKERLWELEFYCKQDDSCNGWSIQQYYEVVTLITNIYQYIDFINTNWFKQYHKFLFINLLNDIKRNIKMFEKYKNNIINKAHIHYVNTNAIGILEIMKKKVNNKEQILI